MLTLGDRVLTLLDRASDSPGANPFSPLLSNGKRKDLFFSFTDVMVSGKRLWNNRVLSVPRLLHCLSVTLGRNTVAGASRSEDSWMGTVSAEFLFNRMVNSEGWRGPFPVPLTVKG